MILALTILVCLCMHKHFYVMKIFLLCFIIFYANIVQVVCVDGS